MSNDSRDEFTFLDFARPSRPHGSSEPQKNGVAPAVSAGSSPGPARSYKRRANDLDDFIPTFLVVLGSGLILLLSLGRLLGWDSFMGVW